MATRAAGARRTAGAGRFKVGGAPIGNLLIVGVVGLAWLLLAGATTSAWVGWGEGFAPFRWLRTDTGPAGRTAVIWAWAGFGVAYFAWAVLAGWRHWAERPWCFGWVFSGQLWWLALLGYSAVALTAGSDLRFDVRELVIRVMAGLTAFLALVASRVPSPAAPGMPGTAADECDATEGV